MQFRQPRRPVRLVFIAGLVFILSLWIYQSVMAQTQALSNEATWHGKMAKISRILGELGPFIYSETAFNDPANREKITQLTGTLAGLAHQIDQKTLAKSSSNAKSKASGAQGAGQVVTPPDADPTLVFLSEQFDDSLTRAAKGFKEGHTDYSRALLRTTVSYCISCHTRTVTNENKPQAGFNDLVSGLSSSEQIRFFAATRQFERVSEVFDKAFATSATTGKAATDVRVVDLESAARIALSVAVRVRQDLDEAARIARRVSEHPSAPESLKQEAKVWLKAVELWKKEAPTAPSTNDGILASARELVIQAQVLQEHPSDGRGDIAYLKASSLLHDLLKRSPNATMKADALYYLGVCYEALRELGFWTLHENYFDACIHTRPHSPRAEVCYARLNDSMTLGYTGTRGTDIPPDVRRYLSTLKNLATASSANPK